MLAVGPARPERVRQGGTTELAVEVCGFQLSAGDVDVDQALLGGPAGRARLGVHEPVAEGHPGVAGVDHAADHVGDVPGAAPGAGGRAWGRRRSALGRGRDGAVRWRRRWPGFDRRSGGNAEAAGDPRGRCRAAGAVGGGAGQRFCAVPAGRRGGRRSPEPRGDDTARTNADRGAGSGRNSGVGGAAATRGPGLAGTSPRTGVAGRNCGFRGHCRGRRRAARAR